MLILFMACASSETQDLPTQAPIETPPVSAPKQAPPPAPAPAEAAPSPSPPVPKLASALGKPSHCLPDEHVVFNCPTESASKVLSLCADLKGTTEDWMQYRFGPMDSPELVAPSEKSNSLTQFRFEETQSIRSMGYSIHFSTEAAQYSISSRSGSGHPGEAEYNNFEGVEVTLKDGTYVSVRCAGFVEDSLSLMTHWLKAME